MARYLNINAKDASYERVVMTLTVNVDDKEFEFVTDSSIAIAKVAKDVFRDNPEKRIDIHVSNRVVRVEEVREIMEQLYHAGVVRNAF